MTPSRPIPLSRLSAACLAALSLGVAACGSAPFDADGATTTMRKFWAAMAANDGERACNMLTRRGREEFIADNLLPCPDLVASLHDELTPREWGAFQRVTVRRVDVKPGEAIIHDGDTAYPAILQRYRQPRDGQPTVLRLVGDRWLIDRLG